jgi:hypothetical protein
MSSYVERRREITARALATSESKLTALWREDPELALDMAEVVNHLPTLERALRSGIIALQFRAVASASLPRLDPAVLVDVLPDLPMDVRRVLFRRIRSKQMTTVAELLIETVQDTDEAARLLPLCGRATVERLLPTLEHAVNQAALAKRHPDLTLDRAFAELAQLESRDDWWQRHGYAIDQVVGHDPARVLDLVDEFGPTNWLPFSARSAAVLARTDAGRFLRQLTDRTYNLSSSAYLAFTRANPPELVWLGRRELVHVLRVLPPSRRSDFFDQINADKDMTRVEIPEAVLRLLPRARRAQEARRLRAIAQETGDESKIRRLTAFLPFDEARAELVKVTHSGEATERAEGYPLLIDCAAKDLRLAELLPWLADRLKREQDPVRTAAIQALTAAHPRAFDESTELTQIAADAFDARDYSAGTGYALGVLCVKLLVHNGSPVALGILADLWTRTGWSSLSGLGRQLRHGQEHEVFRVLEPMVSAAADRAEFGPVLTLVRAFDRRAWEMPRLLELLWSVVSFGLAWQSRDAINLLLEDPHTRNERVQRIVDLEPSAVFVPSVLAVIDSARTDLLELVLGHQVPAGRFAPSGVRQVPLYLRGSRRWLPEQRTRYAKLVMRLADSGQQSRDTQASAVRTLGLIHGSAKRNVLRYLDSQDELIAQAATAALPAIDDPDEGLDLLLARASSDNRGQTELVSMYTVRQCARRVAPSHLAPKLRDAVARGGRVTVRKELVRLVSDFRLPGAVDVLRQTWNVENQHRDVRAACAFAALSWLDDQAAWDLLREAVNGPREVSMQVLRAAPWQVPAQHRAGVAGLIRGVATGPDDRLRTEALSALGNWAQWYPEALTVLSAAVVNLDERAAWLVAAHGLARLAITPAGEAAIIETLHTLLRATGPDAEADRDRPAPQRARAVLGQLQMRNNREGRFRDVAVHVAHHLLGYDEFRPEAVRLRLSTVRVKSAEAVEDLREIEPLVAGRPFLAAETGQHLGVPGWLWDGQAMLDAVLGLGNGHMVLSILATGGPVFGWPEPWRELLRGLRRHADPGVRDAALAIRTASE